MNVTLARLQEVKCHIESRSGWMGGTTECTAFKQEKDEKAFPGSNQKSVLRLINCTWYVFVIVSLMMTNWQTEPMMAAY